MKYILSLSFCLCFYFSEAQNLYGVRAGAGINKDFNVFNAGLYFRSTSTVSLRPEVELMFIDYKTNAFDLPEYKDIYIATPLTLSFRFNKANTFYISHNPILYDVSFFRFGFDHRFKNNLLLAAEYDIYFIYNYDVTNHAADFFKRPAAKLSLAYVFTDYDKAYNRKDNRREERYARQEERKSKIKTEDYISDNVNYKFRGIGLNANTAMWLPYVIDARFNLSYLVEARKRKGTLREIRTGYGFISEEGSEQVKEFLDLNFLYAGHRLGNALNGYCGINPGIAYGDFSPDIFLPYLQAEIGLGTGRFLLDKGIKFDVNVNIGLLGLGAGARLAYVWKK